MTCSGAAKFMTEQARRLNIPVSTPWRTHKRLAWAAKIDPSDQPRDIFNSDPTYLADWVESAYHAILAAGPRRKLLPFKMPVLKGYKPAPVHKAYPGRQQMQKFYKSNQWKQLRYDCFHRHGFCCLSCGRSRKDGIKLHCDHIIPVSVNPSLMADPDNLQPLCSECNEGKGNRYNTDLR